MREKWKGQAAAGQDHHKNSRTEIINKPENTQSPSLSEL